MATTNIEWTQSNDGSKGKTWNPIVGCRRVSPGCARCYAHALHDMRHKAFKEGKKLPQQYAKPFTEIQLLAERLLQPFSWRKPQRVFVNSVSDLFHDDVPFEFIDQMFAVMGLTPQHTYQVLTKRPERMLKYVTSRKPLAWVEAALQLLHDKPIQMTLIKHLEQTYLNNVWLGVSVENQKYADLRIPLLLQTPAAVRFLSCEPLLGAIELSDASGWADINFLGKQILGRDGILWVIIGGESGKGHRPVDPVWIESLVKQCKAANVAVFVKQDSGSRPGKQGRLSDTLWSLKEFPL